MTLDRAPCCDQSLDRYDPIFGTGSAGFSWMMLELSGPFALRVRPNELLF